jgi:hypothetical protein
MAIVAKSAECSLMNQGTDTLENVRGAKMNEADEKFYEQTAKDKQCSTCYGDGCILCPRCSGNQTIACPECQNGIENLLLEAASKLEHAQNLLEEKGITLVGSQSLINRIRDNAAVLRSMVSSGACPNCYSFGHKDCTGDDEQCKTCEHDKGEHCLDNSACQYSDCECLEFSEVA